MSGILFRGPHCSQRSWAQWVLAAILGLVLVVGYGVSHYLTSAERINVVGEDPPLVARVWIGKIQDSFDAAAFLRANAPLLPAIVTELKHADRESCNRVVSALVDTRDKETCAALLPLVLEMGSYEDVRSRIWAAKLLAIIVRDVDAEVAPVAVAELVKMLEDADKRVRLYACYSLAAVERNATPAVTPLRNLLKDADPDLRSAAAYAVMRMGSDAEDAVPELMELLGDAPYVSKTAAIALSRVNVNRNAIVTRLRAGLREPGMLSRFGHAYALWHMEGDQEIARIVFTEALDDEQAVVRVNAAIALEELGAAGVDAIPSLTRALNDGDADVRNAAARALEQIRKGGWE